MMSQPPITTSPNDRIERSILIRAPRERVWQAVSEASSFGAWFGADLKDQTFAPGQRVKGALTHPGFEHMAFDAVIERMQAPELLSYFWHPYPIDAGVDYSQETPTLVVFTLQDAPHASTLLTVVESGFDQVPAHRRVEAFRMNSRGWDTQLKHLAHHACTS